MKNLACLVLSLALANIARAQNIFIDSLVYYYQFEDDTTTIFTHRVDTSYWTSDTLIYQNMIRLSQLVDSEIYCEDWIPCQFSHSDTTAFGTEVQLLSTGQTLFQNHQGEWLHFNFDMAIGESDTIYSYPDGQYTLTRFENIVGYNNEIADTLLVFQISHTNSEGDEQNTPLNGYLVELGLVTGMKRFIDTYHFPQQERGVISSGVEGQRGFQAYRMSDIYDYQPGDEFQIRTYESNGGPPYITYTTTTILERTDFPDTIHYEVLKYIAANSWEQTGGWPPWIETWNFDTLVTTWDVSKIEYVVQPSHDCGPTGIYAYGEFNDIERLHLLKTSRSLQFCPDYECYHPTKYSGYAIQLLIPGIGMVSSDGNGWSNDYNINMICYNINGEQYGECVNMGVDEFSVIPSLKVFPNPTADELFLEFTLTQNADVSLELVNVLGEKASWPSLTSRLGGTGSAPKGELSAGVHTIQLSLEHLAAGVYVLEMRAGHEVVSKRFVKR